MTSMQFDGAHPETVRAFRTVRLLVIGYLALSVLTLVAIALVRHDHSPTTSAMWGRGIGVAISAGITFFLVDRASKGSYRAYRRLRFLTPLVAVAIVFVIATAPYPVWMKIEQGLCGVALAGVAIVANGTHLRGQFAGR
ncbi:hypothetical protein ACFW1A_23070 [Kitasatospora sp. NPDC058965]|uniref:hypothetical protein n=1 Tax=Kitasatospora sp. NPDC058965 TaxID=3346682 RepID=UPI0036CF8EA8